MKNYAQRAVRNTVLVFSLAVVAAGAAYLVRVSFARFLQPEMFGLFYSVFALLTMVCLVADLGLTQAITKFVSAYAAQRKYNLVKSTIGTIALIHLASYGIITLIILAITPYLAAVYFQNDVAALVVPMIMVSFFINSFVYILWYSFQGFQRMGYYGSVDVARMSFVLLFSWIFFGMGRGIIGAALAYIIAPALMLIIFFPLFRYKVFAAWGSAKFSWNFSHVKKLLAFGYPVLIGSAAFIVLSTTDTIMLTALADLRSVGLYNVAVPTAKLMLFFGLAVGSTIFPLVSELWAQKKMKVIQTGVSLLYRYGIMMILPFSLLLVSYPDVVIRLLFGEVYIDAAPALQILAIATIFWIMAHINTNIISGIGKPAVNARYTYMAAGINVLLNAIFIPQYGLLAAAGTTLVSYMLLVILNLRYLRNTLHIKLPLMDWFRTVIAGGVFLLWLSWLKKIIVLNPWAELVLVLALSMPLYVGLLFLFKIARVRDIKDLLSQTFNKNYTT